MKKTILPIIFVVLFFQMANAQEIINSIPYVKVQTIDGKMVNTKTFFKDNKNLLILYSWGCSWGPACQDALDSLESYYLDWENIYNVKALAINMKYGNEYIQCNKELKESHRWTFDFYWDEGDHFITGLFQGEDVHRGCPRFIIVSKDNIILNTWNSALNIKKNTEFFLQNALK